MFTPGGSNNLRDWLSSCSSSTLRELISNTPLQGANREEFEKPTFLFGDSVIIIEECLYEEVCKWFHQIDNVRMFIPKITRSYSLTYLHSIPVPQQSLTKNQDGIPVSNFGSQDPYQDGPNRFLTSLLPGRVGKDFPLGESS